MSEIKEFKERGITVNYIYNIIYVVSNMLFPLITFPYVTRILQAEGLGLASFYQTILHYVILFFSAGIPMYGIREIARKRHNYRNCSKSLIEIFCLHLILTLISYLAILFICLNPSGFITNEKFFIILSIQIILNTLGCEWFYKGIEDFRFITIRSIVVKLISIIFLFTFVKSKGDLNNYAWFVVISTAGSNIWNFWRLRQYLGYDFIKGLHINPLLHLKPSLKVFFFNFIFNSYSVIDIAILGFIGSSIQVGFYSAAMKFIVVTAALLSSLSNILLPRLSNLYSEHNYEEFRVLSAKSFDYIIAICPIFICIIIAEAPYLIMLFCGTNFQPSITTLKIISPLVMTLPIIKLLGMQILYPQGKEKFVAMVLYLSSVIEIIVCLFFYNIYGHNGIAIGVLISNVFAISLITLVCYRYLPIKLKRSHLYYFCFSLLSVFCSYEVLIILNLNYLLNIILVGSFSIFIYVTLLLIINDNLACVIKKCLLIFFLK